MRNPKPKSNAQVRRMFGLAKPKAELAGQDVHDYLNEIVWVVTRNRTSSVKRLEFDEANDVIQVLGGTPLSAYGQSKRNQNYKKQQAGIKTIETDAHLKKIDELAAVLGWDTDRLRGFCQRQIKKDAPTTTEEGNKIVEPLKAMIERQNNVTQFPTTRQPETRNPKLETRNSAAEPAFRRVA